MSWLLGVLNLVALMGLGIWAIRIANKSAESGRTAARAAVESVDVAKKEVRRRRLEHVGELVIRVYLALGVAPEAMTEQQVRLHVALVGLEDELPTCKGIAWSDHSPGGVTVVKRTWQAALDEVKDALRRLD